MSTITGWMIALTVAVCATVLAAAAGDQVLHTAATGSISLGLALLAVREHHTLLASGSSPSIVASSTARNCGLVWTWGALAILVTYALILENKWPEWWHFFIGFTVAAAASLLFGTMMERDAQAGKVDEGILKIGRLLIMVQIVGMIAALVSLFVDGKFPRDLTYADWAGCNIFFFGALAILAISLNAVMYPGSAKKA